MARSTPGPLTILDVGGRPQYWEMMTADLSIPQEFAITLLNVEVQSATQPGFTCLVGDGRAMPQFAEKQFDIVYSNSTIEHVSSFADQQRMASEIRRVGRRYCIQTPNRFFPIEPHFLFPFFQFLPLELRIWLLQHFNLGWYGRQPKRQDAVSEVTEIRLLTRTEMITLFPEAIIYEEKYLGLVKSFVAYSTFTGKPLNFRAKADV